jgi:hypothetical protein
MIFFWFVIPFLVLMVLSETRRLQREEENEDEGGFVLSWVSINSLTSVSRLRPTYIRARYPYTHSQMYLGELYSR